MTAKEIAATLVAYTYHFTNEKELQDGIESVLAQERVDCIREAKLGPMDRIDFLIGDIGVEIKVGHAFSDVVRQLHRYAQSEKISSLVLVTTRLRHQVPEEMNGKEVAIVNLAYTHSL